MKYRLGVILTAAFLVVTPVNAADTQETLASSYRAFLEGRMDDAASGFRYLAALQINVPDSAANLAIVTRDAGQQDGALAQWVKASLMEGSDGFLWNQRAWAYPASDRPKDARESVPHEFPGMHRDASLRPCVAPGQGADGSSPGDGERTRPGKSVRNERAGSWAPAQGVATEGSE